MSKVNLREKLYSFDECWKPRIVGELNGQYVKLAKLHGSYIWHRHDDEDEMFFVVSGCVRIELRDSAVELEEGEFFIVPRGVEHRPVADALAEVMLFEPASTRNTGNVHHSQTIEPEDLQKI